MLNDPISMQSTKIQKVGNSTGQIVLFLQQIHCKKKGEGTHRTRETWKTHWLNSMCRPCSDPNLSNPTIPKSYKIEKFEHWLCMIINIKELLWRSLYMIMVLCTYNLRAFYLLEIPTEIFIDSDMVSVTYLERIPPVSGGVARHSWSKRGRQLVFVEAE